MACCSACAVSRFGCGGQGCALAELAPSPPTMGGFLPQFRTPSSVRELKSRLRPSFDTADAAVKSCSKFPPNERNAWDGFFRSWTEYRDADESWWDAASEYDNGLVLEKSLGEWQEKIASRCDLAGPRVKTDEDVNGASLSAVKWASAAVIAVAVVWGVRTIIK